MELKFYERNHRFSRVVEAGESIYLCGNVSRDLSLDIAGQTKDVLLRITEILEKYGSGKEHIASIIIFLKDVGDFDAMNEEYDKWVTPGREPARTCVQAITWNPSTLIEVTAIAVKRDAAGDGKAGETA